MSKSKEQTRIISHVRETDMEIQLNEDHQLGVAKLAESFASEFGMGELGRIMGLLHDKGKEQKEWQKYIQGVTGYNLEYANVRKGPNHAYIGAIIAQKKYPKIAPFISQPIAGHHRGLYDYYEFKEVTQKELPSDITIDKAITYSMPRAHNMEKHDYHHIVRMLFSCLVDADSLDTESFITPEIARLRVNKSNLSELLLKLETHLQSLRERSADTLVNHIRNEVQDFCIKESQGERGFYSLTVPTGGGKTLSSILWALKHAVKNAQKRIIIAIPYTSIIVQTAAILKEIFGEENVLEHHSNFNLEEIRNYEKQERYQLATENWDYPIIVTTNVQLFESFFSNKRSECRKIHNLANSVLILDEVQTLPMDYYLPIVNTLDTLQRIFRTSILFSTASQPVLTGNIKGTNPLASFIGLPTVHEIIPKTVKLHDKLRRVKLEFLSTPCTYDDIANKLSEYKCVLCIVNTRKDAKEIYERLPNDGIRIHLSRMMCPNHIASTIMRLKKILRKSDGHPIRVITTQLIEAGVDIDFPIVFRQEAGLDSILQAAGRCNREGKQDIGTAYIFSLEKEHTLPSGFMTQSNNARLALGQHHDWFSPDTMNKFFRQLHSRVDNFDKKQMKELLYKPTCEFEEAANKFHLIEDRTIPVLINWDKSIDLYQELISEGISYPLMKKIAQFCVNIRERDFKELLRIGAIEEPYDNIYIISNPAFYKADTGLTINNQWIEETYII